MTAILLDLTTTQAEQQVRKILNEPTPLYWSKEEIQNWIKEGCIDISTKTLCYENYSDIDLSTAAYTFEYTTGSSLTDMGYMVKVFAVLYSSTDIATPTWTALMRIHPRMIGFLPTAPLTTGALATPKYYYHFGQKLGIYPVSDTPSLNVRVFYARATETIANLPATYKAAAIDYAVYCARLKERDNPKAIQALQKYQAVIMQQRSDTDRLDIDAKSDFQIPDRVEYVK